MPRILITGGTGTFGQAAADHLLMKGHTVTVYSRDEQKQSEMARRFPNCRFFLGDVRDAGRLTLAMRHQHAVIHAAALKIVPKLESDPIEAVKTNVYGSQNVIEAALHNKVARVILLSTDKAVNPVNLYGATKKTAEHLFTAANVFSKDNLPRFSVVRYGNVWGSRGSVIEVWEDALKKGRKIEVTDPTMTRFFMTKRAAVALVEKAMEEGVGGEIFVPILDAYRLKDLAAAFKAVYTSARFKPVGIRAGEKKHEELISCYEFERSLLLGHNVVAIYSGQQSGEKVHTKFGRSELAHRMGSEALQDFIRGRKHGTD